MDCGKSSYSTLTDGGNLIIPLILRAFAATISLHMSELSYANPSGNMSGKVKSWQICCSMHHIHVVQCLNLSESCLGAHGKTKGAKWYCIFWGSYAAVASGAWCLPGPEPCLKIHCRALHDQVSTCIDQTPWQPFGNKGRIGMGTNITKNNWYFTDWMGWNRSAVI